jgi:hypothetical protein
VPFPFPLDDFPDTGASDNDGSGIMARSGNEVLVAGLFPLFGVDRVIEANDNGATGFDLSSMDSTTVFGVRANRNDAGMVIQSGSDVQVIGSSALNNTVGPGFRINSAGTGNPDPPLPGLPI